MIEDTEDMKKIERIHRAAEGRPVRMFGVMNRGNGDFHRVLCVCSGGIARSPTAAWVLSQGPYNFNTRAAGTDRIGAVVPVDATLVAWSNEIVCMEDYHLVELRKMFGKLLPNVTVLNIEDEYYYRDPALVHLIRTRFDRQRQKAA